MTGCACEDNQIEAGQFDGRSPAYKRALIAVVVINAAMFMVEMSAGFLGSSQALKADALDFAGDTATYALSLAVIGAALRTRATAALIKGASLGLMAAFVLTTTIASAFGQATPAAPVMSAVGFAALAANVLQGVPRGRTTPRPSLQMSWWSSRDLLRPWLWFLGIPRTSALWMTSQCRSRGQHRRARIGQLGCRSRVV